MYKDIENYQPQHIDYVVDEEIKERFPLELDFNGVEGVESLKDAMRLIGEKFTPTFPEGQVAMRLLDQYEKTAIREEYCIIQEQILPKLQEKYLELRHQMKDAEDEMKGKAQEINRYAMEVRAGVREQRLKASETFQIALAGYYLTYVYDNGSQTFKLAKAFEIPDKSEIWANDERNRKAMLELFGAEFEETEGSIDDLPFGAQE